MLTRASITKTVAPSRAAADGGAPAPAMLEPKQPSLASASQASPSVSLSRSRWEELLMRGQLSQALGVLSPSKSSQASPTPSPLPSSWVGLYTLGQLSSESGQPSGSGVLPSQVISPSLAASAWPMR